MQVDQKPSPWPCVVMLVGLLFFCLAVPRLWRPSDSDTERADDVAADSIAQRPAAVTRRSTTAPPSLGLGFDSSLVQAPIRPLANNNWVSLCPPPTLEELADSARSGVKRFEAGADWRASDWSRWPLAAAPLATREELWPAADAPTATVRQQPNPLVAVALARIDNLLATYSIADAVIRLAARSDGLQTILDELIGRGLADVSQPQPAASTLRMIGPNDRVASPPEPERIITSVPEPDETETRRPVEVTPPAAAETHAAEAAEPWCVPHALFEQLDRLARHPISARWAQETIDELRFVTDRANWESGKASASLDDLSRLTGEANRLAQRAGDDRLRVELLRAHWALSRRMDCWRAIGEIQVDARSQERIASRGSLFSLFAGLPQPPQLRPDLPVLTDQLEAYETSRDPRLARRVVEEQRSLQRSPDALDQSLADAVEQHYRNANVRIAITAELINRLVASERSEMRAVRDRIAGTPVRGSSHTRSQSFVRLEPAEGRWQLDVESQGVVESDTLAHGRRARLRSVGATDFNAEKSIVVDTLGVHMQPACVDATNYNRLVCVKTQYDWVPLLGAYARSQAVRQYRAKRPRAKAEVEWKVATQAQEDVDQETQEAVARIEREVRTRFTDPIAQSGIEVTPIELSTTAERIVARLRVAGNHQLGAHTPRPRALSDSLASLQLHETALTNAAVSLQLDGARYTATELQRMLRDRFPRFALARPAETRSDTIFDFAYRDAVQFRIADGRLEVLVAFTGFEQGGRRTRDFIAHVFYVPVVDGLEVELVRDGPLGIEGRLGAGERARLHNVFNTLLSSDRRLPLVELKDRNDPRLAGLMITQLVLEDGWLGIAIGPAGEQRVAERSRSLR